MESLSQSFRALGDPTRLRVLRLLTEASLNVSELVSLVGVAQSSVSHHLAKLRALGLVRDERQAGFTYASLALDEKDPRWPLVELARSAEDTHGDRARLADLLRAREDRVALNERLLEPGQSWFLWADALASLLPALDVADFGCGSGLFSTAIARWARHVHAIDQDPRALEAARARAAREGQENLTFLCEDLHALSLPEASQDLVVISQSLHHVEDPAAVLREARRLLRPGGRLTLLELFPHSEQWVVDRLGHRHLGFDPDRLYAELEGLGFSRLERRTHARDASAHFRVFLLTGVRS